MVGRRGVGPAASGWSLRSPTFRCERSPRRAPGAAVRPRRRRLAFVWLGMGFRRGPRVGRSKPLFGPILFPVAAGGDGMERRRRGRGGTFPPEGPGEPSDCWERGGGLLGAVG